MSKEFSNELTLAQAERLALLIGECADVIHAATKVLRHGYESRDPRERLSGGLRTGPTNRRALEREMGSLRAAMILLCDTGDTNKEVIHQEADAANSRHSWLHHKHPAVVQLPVKSPIDDTESFQNRVDSWLQTTFPFSDIRLNKRERNLRFLEEAIELVQACGLWKHEVLPVVDYVYGRKVGAPFQEVGGVMITLNALCTANMLNVEECAEAELKSIWGRADEIKAKQQNKPSIIKGTNSV